MKKVGIVIRDFWENDKEFVGCRTDVLDSFFKYPVNIISIPIYFDFGKVLELVSLCDGIVLMGGDHYLKMIFYLFIICINKIFLLWEFVLVCR